MLKIVSAKLAAAHEFSYPFGQVFVVINKNGTENSTNEVDSLSLNQELFSRFQTEFLKNTSEKPFNALKNTLQAMNEIEIAACSFVDGVVYSRAVGGGRVLIYRNGSLATILESDNSVISASGYPKDRDLILIATKTFFEDIPVASIKSALTNGDPQRIVETFAPNTQGGVIVLKFESEENEFKVSDAISEERPLVQSVPVVQSVPIAQKISNFLNDLSKKLPKRNIYIKNSVEDEVSSHSKKMTFSIGIILLAILLVSIGFGVRQKRLNDTKNKYQGILAIAQGDVDQAIALASVSPDKSRELFTDSEAKLQEILALNVKDPKVADLQKKIDESKNAILGEYDGTPSLFLDLSLLSSGFSGDAISASNGQIFILDKSGQRIVSVAEDTKKSKVVAGPDVLGSATNIASYQNAVFVLAGDGIYEVDSGKTKVIDKNWSGEAFISAFAGNMYVLDKSGSVIYRYIGQTGNTFSTQQNWLSASTKPNFSGAASWGMDGAIYVLFPNSKILKYSLGSPQNFSITGITPEIGNIDAIYADPDNQYLYLLDRAGKRVVVIDKKGNYKAQYVSDQIASATSLVVSEAQKEIILLTGDKLLSIQIKN